ncbi:hypothetical protein Tco_1260292, partial [Tanacetum coccineum]
ARGDDEEVITDDVISNLEDGNLIEENEIAQIFRIDTVIFHFETPLCEAFKEFNYLLKIDVNALTNDISGFKTYNEYKDAWIYEWNKDVLWVANLPWLDYGPWMEPSDNIEHIGKSFCFKNGHANYEWYENLEEDELKDEALNSKAIFEGSKGVDEEPSDNDRTHYSPSDEWEDLERTDHIEANSNYNPYLDVSRIFNDHVWINNDYETQKDEGWRLVKF